MRLDTEGIISHLLLALRTKDRELALVRNPMLAAAMGCSCGAALVGERARNANVLADLVELAGGKVEFTPKPEGYFNGKRIKQSVSTEGVVTLEIEQAPTEEKKSDEAVAPKPVAVEETDGQTSEEFLIGLREGNA